MWQQLVDAAVGPGRQLVHHVLEVGVGVVAIELGRLDQAHHRGGALAGIITGAVTVLVWKQFGWLGLYEIIPGFILAWLATVVVSRMGPAPSQSILKAHAAVESEFERIGAR